MSDLNRFKRMVVPLLMLLIVTACQSEPESLQEGDDLERKPFNEVPAREAVEVEQAELPFVHPLSGIGTNEVETTRPLAVVVSNDRNARPLTGLQEADIVYEVLTEASITRFIAIYHSEHPETIGPVRSAREVFIDLSSGFDSLFVAHGFSPGAEARIQADDLYEVNGMHYDGGLFERVATRPAPHNSYVHYDELLAHAEQAGIPMSLDTPPLSFRDEAIDGNAASGVTISYMGRSSAEYQFDAEDREYIRFSDGEPLVDEATGEAYRTKNVMVVEARHSIIDDAGRREIDVLAGGAGLLLQDGKYEEVNWTNVDGRIVPDGEQLIKGNTWINIVDSLDSVTIQDE